jgi:hypothetical protein
MPALDEAMMWHPRAERDPAHLWLRSLLKRVASAMPSASAEPDKGRPAAAPALRFKPRRT